MENQKEEITIIIDKNLVDMLKEAVGGSQSSLSTLIQNILYRFPVYEDFDLLGRVTSITGIRIPILEKYYERSRRAIEFWRAILPTKPNAEIIQDQNGHYFAKFPKYEDYILLPETGHLMKDIEKGTENIENAIKTITNNMANYLMEQQNK